MFILGFDGCSLSPEHWLREAIARQGLGGVILFDRNVDGRVQNISSPDQLRDLTSVLQALAPQPLFICVDQEGGMVCRLKQRDGFAPTIGAADLGASGGPEETARAADAMAGTLARAGINLNLAPVVDLDLNPDNPIISRYGRSFGGRVEDVVAHAGSFITAHHRQNIGCCLKHFPGHGSARGDSHLGFVDITDDWQESELAPFQRLIDQGQADAVMTAHLVHRRLEPQGLPATLSPRIINHLLRRGLGFDGPTMTDDLQMRAIADHYGFAEAVRRAVLAGVDLMIVGNNLARSGNVLDQGIRAVRDLLDKGTIDENHIGASLARIAELKQKIQGEIPWRNSRPTVRQ